MTRHGAVWMIRRAVLARRGGALAPGPRRGVRIPERAIPGITANSVESAA